jgi:hypothetical protein
MLKSILPENGSKIVLECQNNYGIMKKLLSVIIICWCYSCNNNSINKQEVSTDKKDTSVNHPDTSPNQQDTTYTIRLNDTVNLYLQQWDSTIDLHRYLGKPIKQRIRKLDQNSDTFAGSYIKDVEYDGLKLQLFSPPQNGKTFWVQEIIFTNNKYKTAKGITIGDEWQKVKDAYPTLQKFPGENENMYYVSDAGYEKSIEMEFENSKLKKLRMYYMMN